MNNFNKTLFIDDSSLLAIYIISTLLRVAIRAYYGTYMLLYLVAYCVVHIGRTVLKSRCAELPLFTTNSKQTNTFVTNYKPIIPTFSVA